MTDWTRANTDWFRDARWGVFFHYLADTASNKTPMDEYVDEWNHRIDGFDVVGLAAQLAEVKAGYFVLTLGQNSGYYLAPNATYDALVGYAPSHCASRDLVAELADALASYNIPLLVYFTAAAPCNDRRAMERLCCTPPWNPELIGFQPGSYLLQDGADEQLTVFQRHWEAVIREWSLRWGPKVRGWWIDGCYHADVMYRQPDAPNFRSFAEAMKAGNPGSLVAFNPGVRVPVISHSPYEDYTAGELDSAYPMTAGYTWTTPLKRYIDGAQLHVLTFLGDVWGGGAPRFCDEFVVGATKQLNRHEGVVTWDMPPTREGLIPEAFLRQLRVLRDATR